MPVQFGFGNLHITLECNPLSHVTLECNPLSHVTLECNPLSHVNLHKFRSNIIVTKIGKQDFILILKNVSVSIDVYVVLLILCALKHTPTVQLLEL